MQNIFGNFLEDGAKQKPRKGSVREGIPVGDSSIAGEKGDPVPPASCRSPAAKAEVQPSSSNFYLLAQVKCEERGGGGEGLKGTYAKLVSPMANSLVCGEWVGRWVGIFLPS